MRGGGARRARSCAPTTSAPKTAGPVLGRRGRARSAQRTLVQALHRRPHRGRAQPVRRPKPRAFDADAETIGTILAAHAAAAILASREGEQLQSALTTRDRIGQAKGIIMERYGVDDVAGVRDAPATLAGQQRETRRRRPARHRYAQRRLTFSRPPTPWLARVRRGRRARSRREPARPVRAGCAQSIPCRSPLRRA